MLTTFLIAALAAATPQQTAAMTAQLTSVCEDNVKGAEVKSPKGFCGCFAAKAAADAAALKDDDKAVFLILTETAGDPVAAQKLAQSRLQMDVSRYAAARERVNPIGAKAGEACLKAAQ